MRRICLFFGVVCLALLWGNAQANWPHWRGPNENGLVNQGNPPIEWSESKNVRWKTEIPGLGHATPIVWEDRIFVQTAVQTETVAEDAVEGRGSAPPYVYQYKVMALDRNAGTVIWEKTLREIHPHEGMHQTASFASTSGITDGELLYAFFGSQGLYCLDMDGNVQWEKDFGKMRTRNSFGEGTSPAIYGNTMVINWDQEDASFIVALDKRTGKELWRNERDEVTSWSTPFIVEHQGVHQVIVSASAQTKSYDLKTGEVIWECAGLGTNVIPTPVYADGIVYVMSGHRRPALQAIILDKAKGDITGSDAILWSLADDTPYVSSPLLYGDNLYFLKNRNGILSCYNAKTGEANYGPVRLEGMRRVYASLVGVNDRVYISDLGGTTLVIKNDTTFEVLASNDLDEGMSASPVIVGDVLYLRGEGHLYCIAAE
ncbi:MAG: PQQ-binding-like beta-propeller repeat protein [Candidatus Latescibacteria bacterium]|nr:PQQ-binding-like beta-propeller repeat protein [Candidatus Latescibacterota bacterium]MBT5830998.1 PQQ-binding-like beta-propeller repeat protein [Candidatus Latescibacterota bacterium]